MDLLEAIVNHNADSKKQLASLKKVEKQSRI